jgi:dienelactone hydrolase
MMLKVGVWIGVGLTALAPTIIDGAMAEPPTARPELMAAHTFNKELRETLFSVPVQIRTVRDKVLHNTEMQLTTYRPAGPGPFPLLIYQHGRSLERSYPSRFRAPILARHFVRRGFAVLVPTRIGYGGLGAKIDPESGGMSCSDYALDLQVDAVLTQTRAVLAFAQTLPWATPARVVLAGQSVGGYTSVVAASRGISSVSGVINLAGGAGARSKGPPGNPFCPERVTKIFSEAGKTLRLPTLWIYARNDRAWGAQHPVTWHKAFVDAGGKADFISLAEVAGDGHGEISNSVQLWRGPVDGFLSNLGFKLPALVAE